MDALVGLLIFAVVLSLPVVIAIMVVRFILRTVFAIAALRGGVMQRERRAPFRGEMEPGYEQALEGDDVILLAVPRHMFNLVMDRRGKIETRNRNVE